MLDTVIIGAGFAGLSAAKTLMAEGRDEFVVLEARGRVGGRTKAGRIGDIPIDLGGMWMGPSQTHLKSLAEHYQDSRFVKVKNLNNSENLERAAFLRPDALNGSNELELFVFANDATDQALLIARLDNLGKGASGAAVQNLNLMLGLAEDAGL